MSREPKREKRTKVSSGGSRRLIHRMQIGELYYEKENEPSDVVEFGKNDARESRRASRRGGAGGNKVQLLQRAPKRPLSLSLSS